MSNFRLVLSRKLLAGKSQVMVRVSINRNNRPMFKTGIFIDPAHFSNGEIVIPNRGKFNSNDVRAAKQEQADVASYCERIDEIIMAALGHVKTINREWIQTVMDLDDKGKINKEDGKITFEGIRNAFRRMSNLAKYRSNADFKEVMTIYDYIDEYCRVRDLSDNRKMAYMSLKRIIFRFSMFQKMVEGNQSFEFDLETLCADDMCELKAYIQNEGSLSNKFPIIYNRIIESMNQEFPRVKKCRDSYGLENKSENYSIYAIKKLVSLTNWLRNEKNVLDNNPFAGFDIGTPRYVKRPIYLTIEERKHLLSFDFSDNMELSIQRDIFIFHCLVGCRYGDLCRLTPLNVNNGVLEYVAGKTRKNKEPAQPRVPLTQTAKILIDRYAGLDLNGRLFPFVYLDKYNHCLKEIFKIAGLDRTVFVYNPQMKMEEPKPLYEVASSHMARRTFVGNTYKMTKDPNIIGMMSGHALGSKAFARYRDIDDEDLLEVVEKIDLD